MIKFNEIKMGDYVMGEFEGKMWPGEVINLNGDEKQVCVETEVQSFWFEQQHLYPIPISDAEMMRLNFTKEDMADGGVKYKKGSFRLLLPRKDEFTNFEMWYREDKRHHPDIHYVHQLQNHYFDMTKIHLTDEVLAS